jgi:hypothetical protein
LQFPRTYFSLIILKIKEKKYQFKLAGSELGGARPVLTRCCRIFSVSNGCKIIAIIFIGDEHFGQTSVNEFFSVEKYIPGNNTKRD